MIRAKFMLLLMTVLMLTEFSFCQNITKTSLLSANDSVRFKKAIQFLNNKLGNSFVNESLEYSGEYQSTLDVFTFTINTKKGEVLKNMIAVFFDGDKIDTTFNTKINSDDLKKFYLGMPTDNIFYNKEYSFSIAKKIGFNTGLNGWGINISGVMDDASWVIIATSEQQDEHPHRASGKELRVNLRTGKYSINDWISIE